MGTKFRVMCSIEKGSTPLMFQWFKNNEKLDTDSKSDYNIETSDDFSVFSIKSVSKIDSANYSCNVRNAFGTDSQTVLLSVRGIAFNVRQILIKILFLCPTVPPTWVKEPNDVRVRAGEDVVVECIADGLPKPVTKWISSKGTVIEGEILNLAKHRRGSSETYECVADNGIGDSLRKTINVFFSGKSFDLTFIVRTIND